MSTLTKTIQMAVMGIRKAKVTYPTGDPKFSVMQSFPAGFDEVESDPFLMCDAFGPSVSKGKESNPDSFPVQWHPHRGMDILTYLVEGTGRHADSLGNRGEYSTPGMQWISVGSGIEHAEGGGTPEGVNNLGFQIWINVPSSKKMDDPRYGTEPPENLPVIPFSFPGLNTSCAADETDSAILHTAANFPATVSTAPKGSAFARVLAGDAHGRRGPFKTVQDVQILDYVLAPRDDARANTDDSQHPVITHAVPTHMDNCLIYVYEGEGTIAGAPVSKHQVIRLDATDPAIREFVLEASPTKGMSAMVFAGKRLNQPIAWHGPFVMTTDAEIRQTLQEYRAGTFLKKRASWDYKKISTKPTDMYI